MPRKPNQLDYGTPELRPRGWKTASAILLALVMAFLALLVYIIHRL
jgi:hypothetical protein